MKEQTTAAIGLDDVPLACLAAVTSAAWTALPDYVSSPGRRWMLRGGIALGAGAAATGWMMRREASDPAPARSDSPADVSTEMAREGEGQTASDAANGPRPLVTAGVAVAGIGVLAGALVGSQKIDDAVARWFSRRGVRRPYTATGLLWAALEIPVYLFTGGGTRPGD